MSAVITLTYVKSLGDATIWACISYLGNTNGDVIGNTVPRSIHISFHTWDQLVGLAADGSLLIHTDPNPNYMLEG